MQKESLSELEEIKVTLDKTEFLTDKKKTAGYVEEAANGTTIFIEDKGEPVAVLISIEEWERLTALDVE